MKIPQIIALLLIAVLPLEGKDFSLSKPVRATYPKSGQVIKQEMQKGLPVLRFSMDSSQKKWGEIYWPNPETLPPFQTLKICVQLKAGKKELPRSASFRIADRKSEIFQFNTKEPLKFDKDGNCSAVYEINAEGKQKSFWGGDRNGIMDQPCRLAGMSFSFPGKEREGEILITKISWDYTVSRKMASNFAAKKKDTQPFQFRFDLKTPYPIPVIGPDEKDFYAYITNLENRHLCFYVSFTIRDAEGKIKFQKPSFPAFVFQKSVQNNRVYFTLPAPKEFGLYEVEIVVQSHDKKHKWVSRRTFAKICSTKQLPPYKKGEFRFGINLNTGADPSLDAASAGLAGTSFLRVGCNSLSLWPKPDIEYAGKMQYCLQEYKKNNLSVALLFYAVHTTWMFENESDRKIPGKRAMIHPVIWREYCDKIFRNFGKDVHQFEVWNEPDIFSMAHFSPNDYFRLAKIAKEEHDKYVPDSELLSAGFCSFTSKDRFQEKAMSLCKDIFDIHCFHGHGPFSAYRETIDKKLLPMRKKIGIDRTMPWYAHETAITATGYGTHLQAVTLFQKLIFSWSRGAIGYTWYCLRNPGKKPVNPEHNYGLLDYDYYPKEAFPVYRMLAQTFRGKTSFIREFTGNPFSESFLFRRGKDLLIPAWNKSTKTCGNALLFSTDAKAAEIIDLYGNVTPIKIINSNVILPLGKNPVTLRLKQADKCVMEEGLCKAVNNQMNLSTEPVPCELIFTNPYASSGTFTIKTDVPGCLQTDLPTSVTVPGKQILRKKFFVKVKSRAEFPVSTQQINFHYALNGIPRGTASICLIPTLLLNPSFSEKPSAVLNSRLQTVEFFDADPGNVFRLRKNNEDLSAKIWIASDQENLRFKVLVTDDIHRQKETAQYIWKADSIQIFLHVPGQSETWELGAALHQDGHILKNIWRTGDRSVPDASRISAAVSRKGTKTEYLITIPWKMLGAKEHYLRYNLLINESDSDRREAMMRLAPGIGEGSVNLSDFLAIKQAQTVCTKNKTSQKEEK